MMNSRQQRCSRRPAACCLILAFQGLQGQSFLAPSCFLNAQRTSFTQAAGQQQTPSRAAAARPVSSLNSAPFLAASQEQAKPPGQWSPVRPGGKVPDQNDNDDDEFNINVGRAMDYLAADVALMFCTAPRLEIFTPDVRLKDPVGELCHGRRLYGALHTSLRVLGAVTTSRPRVGVTSIMFYPEKREIELKWTMTASAPFMGDPVKLSAVSLYDLNDHGLIYQHSIDNRIKRDLWEYSHSWMGVLKADSPPSL
ncbi:unnamed protein product [Ectocarpus sp. 12 AP-2014]